MLLRSIDRSEAERLIEKQKKQPKYSVKTRWLALDKKLFKRDLLWSLQDGDKVEIDKLITLYLDQPDEDDTFRLIELFGLERVQKVAEKKIKPVLAKTYKEVSEQIAFIQNPELFFATTVAPSVESFLTYPTKRHAARLVKLYGKDHMLEMSETDALTFAKRFQIRKMIEAA